MIWLSEDEVLKIPDDILEMAQENQEGQWDDNENEYGWMDEPFYNSNLPIIYFPVNWTIITV